MRHQLPVYSPISLRGICSATSEVAARRTAVIQSAARLLERTYNADRAVLCGSGTQALRLALRVTAQWLGSLPVAALPVFTCYDVGTAAVGAGSPVMLYDIDPGTLGPDIASLRQALESGARVVVVSPLYGVPLDWGAVCDCVAPYAAVIIEDAAQGHGASWQGRPLGSLGQVSVVSFGRGKGWTGMGGGALLLRGEIAATVDARVAGSAFGVELKTMVNATAQWALGRPSLYGLPASIPWLGLGETIYKKPAAVHQIATTSAALIMHSQATAFAEAAARRARAAELLGRLPARPGIRTIEVPDGSVPGYLRFPLRLAGGMSGFSSRTQAQRLGIAPSYPTTLSALEAVQQQMAAGRRNQWLGGEELSRQLVTVPTHTRLTEADRAGVLRLLDTYSER
ncbi:MAG: DegT/DnrJ/EryC1/StrS family aminotransferase [Gemmatimonadota bacterium]|nr:MAG: DegT/DnrJ/EryC1/StrS family aminotransferase [Gemmatimonadota bacterium]